MMIQLELRGKIFIVDRNVLMNVSGTYFYGMLSSGAWQPVAMASIQMVLRQANSTSFNGQDFKDLQS
jgi:hypothetical protein